MANEPQPEGLAVRVIQTQTAHGTETVELKAQGETAFVLIIDAESFASCLLSKFHVASCVGPPHLPALLINMTQS